MISALEAALESPQLRPEARDRIQSFLRLYRAAATALEEMRADVFVRRLIERIGLRRHQLFAASARDRGAAGQPRRASVSSRRRGRGASRAPRRATSSATSARSPTPGELGDDPPAEPAAGRGAARRARAGEGPRVRATSTCSTSSAARSPTAPSAPSGYPRSCVARLPRAGDAPSEAARLAYVAMTRAREALVLSCPEASGEGSGRALARSTRPRGRRSAPTRSSTTRSSSGPPRAFTRPTGWCATRCSRHRGGPGAVARRDAPRHRRGRQPRGRPLPRAGQARGADPAPGRGSRRPRRSRRERAPGPGRDARAAGGARGLGARRLRARGASASATRRRDVVAARQEPSLEAFIPRRGGGLALSASDIDLYRICPLKYKFARVFAIPAGADDQPALRDPDPPGAGALPRRGAARGEASRGRARSAGGLDRLLALFEAGWRRAGFGSADDELQYRDRAVAALARYYERHVALDASPVWLERGFAFGIGPHQLRGRVDRVDRLPDGGYELIDYKTGEPERRGRARATTSSSRSTGSARARRGTIDAAHGSYWYVLDGREGRRSRARPTTASGSSAPCSRSARGSRPRTSSRGPRYEVCSWCDYRLICPALEARAL